MTIVNYEIQIIGEGGCVAGELCGPVLADIFAAVRAYKARKLRPSEFPAAFNLHHYGKNERLTQGSRPTETAGVEKWLVANLKDDEGEEVEIILAQEFI